jgi:hypothetical protein
MIGSPADIPFEKMPQRSGDYRLFRGLRPESLYPIVQGYKDTASVGMRVNFSDPLQLNRANVSLGWSPGDLPSEERVHLDAEYRRYDWRGRVSLNRADFYDLFGPTKTSRKGYVVGVGHKTTLIFDEPRRLELDLEGSFSGSLDQLPEYQNVPVQVDQLISFEGRLAYTDVRNSLGNVDDETGRRWSVVGQADLVDGTTFPKLRGTFDRGWAGPAAHSSVWVRASAGIAQGDRSDPFANFFFGGFGNNYVDRGDEKRYREYYSFPGLTLNEIPGRNFVKTTVEWNLPPVRFRRAGTPGFHATWVRPALFVGGLATNLDSDAARQRAGNAGAQIDVRFSVLSALDLTVSFGAAAAFRDGARPAGEGMISLKILR